MEYEEDSSESEETEGWFILKPFDPKDFSETVTIYTFNKIIKCLYYVY